MSSCLRRKWGLGRLEGGDPSCVRDQAAADSEALGASSLVRLLEIISLIGFSRVCLPISKGDFGSGIVAD